MRKIIPFFILLCGFTKIQPDAPVLRLALPMQNRLIKVAVVDTGMNLSDRWLNAPEAGLAEPKICPGLSKDFTNTSIKDEHGHGTHIAGLIAKYAETASYCLVIYKYYLADNTGQQNLYNTIAAFKTAIDQKVDVINYSGGGVIRSEEECTIIKRALDAGIIVNAAAGNESSNINIFRFYPAMCDKRVNVIGAIDRFGEKLPMSNYTNSGGVKVFKELGRDVLSTLPNGQFGYMSGTSQATAVFSGKTIKRLALELVK